MGKHIRNVEIKTPKIVVKGVVLIRVLFLFSPSYFTLPVQNVYRLHDNLGDKEES